MPFIFLFFLLGEWLRVARVAREPWNWFSLAKTRRTKSCWRKVKYNFNYLDNAQNVNCFVTQKQKRNNCEQEEKFVNNNSGTSEDVVVDALKRHRFQDQYYRQLLGKTMKSPEERTMRIAKCVKLKMLSLSLSLFLHHAAVGSASTTMASSLSVQ